MHIPANTVAHIFAHHGIAVCLHKGLHCVGYIRQAVALPGELQTLKEGILGHTDEAQGFVGHLAAGVGAGAIAMVAADICTHIHADDVTLAQHPFAGDTVDDLIVDADAYTGRITVVVQEGGGSPLLPNKVEHCLVNLLGCYAGLYHFPGQGPGSRGNFSRQAHRFDLVS